MVVAACIACIPTHKILASSTKSDREVISNMGQLITKMSDIQRRNLFKKADIIQEHLRNISQKERDELTNTARNISNSIDFRHFKASALEKIKPASLDRTVKNFKKHQQEF